MQAFDFDNTIYKGESAFDFALFVIRKKISLVCYLPHILKLLWKYKKCKMTVEEFQETFNSYASVFLKNKDLVEELVIKFWEKNEYKLYFHIIDKIKPEDFIITASPDFLIEPIKSKINTKNFLCSEVDLNTGKITYLNFGKNKVKKFVNKMGKKKITNFYTDSYNDKPMMDYAKHVFLITKGKINQLK